LTGTYPFPGPSAAELARQIQLTVPKPPSQVTGEPIDPALERVVLRLLDRSETERIGSATELLRELGHAGDSKGVLSTRPTGRPASRVGARRRSLDHTLRRGIRRNYLWLGLCVVVYLFFRGPISGVVVITGLVVFYAAHRWGRRWRLAAGVLVGLAITLLGAWVGPCVDIGLQTGMTGVMRAAADAGLRGGFVLVLALVAVLAILLTPILAPVFACAAYARAGRLRRERVLLRAAAAGTGSDEYLALLRRELDFRYEDVGFHLKYAEALAARGDDRSAAVEARLLLAQDPYHFTGNLLLAQCYYRLGLLEDAEAVCDAYLAVAGYGFEFEELRGQCRAARGVPT